MTTIMISDLQPTGSDLLIDSENFLNELTDAELIQTRGGTTPLCLAGAVVVFTLIAGCGDNKPKDTKKSEPKPIGIPAPGIGAP
jgi:hypothetical protein